MASIFHLTTRDVAREVGYNVFALRQLFCTKGAPPSQRAGAAKNSPHRFTTADVVAYLRATRRRGLDVDALIACDSTYRTQHGLCGGGLCLGDQKVSRARAVIRTLTDEELARFATIKAEFNKGLATAFWDRIAAIDPATKEALILHPEVFAAVLAYPNNLPISPPFWSDWASQFILANSDAATITALAA